MKKERLRINIKPSKRSSKGSLIQQRLRKRSKMQSRRKLIHKFQRLETWKEKYPRSRSKKYNSSANSRMRMTSITS
jgi:hypothetical protein